MHCTIWICHSYLVSNFYNTYTNSGVHPKCYSTILSFKWRTQRTPHYFNETKFFFIMSILKNCRKYLTLCFLYKLITNKKDCLQLIENLNLKINYSYTRSKDTFLIMNCTNNIVLCILQWTHLYLFIILST